MAKYKRILLKLSGESLMGEKQYGIDEKRLFYTLPYLFYFIICRKYRDNLLDSLIAVRLLFSRFAFR